MLLRFSASLTRAKRVCNGPSPASFPSSTGKFLLVSPQSHIFDSQFRFYSVLRRQGSSPLVSSAKATSSSRLALAVTPRRFAAALAGKTSPLLGLWSAHKLKIIIGTAVLTVLGIFGPWSVIVFGFKTLLGLGGIALMVMAYFTYRKRKNVVVYEPFIREMSKQRKKIEEYIGPYELPHANQVLSWHKKAKGRKMNVIVYQFQLDGARGKGYGAMRAVEYPVVNSDGSRTNKWLIEKLRVDLQSLKHHGQALRFEIVDKDLTSVKYLDNVHIEEL